MFYDTHPAGILARKTYNVASGVANSASGVASGVANRARNVASGVKKIFSKSEPEEKYDWQKNNNFGGRRTRKRGQKSKKRRQR